MKLSKIRELSLRYAKGEFAEPLQIKPTAAKHLRPKSTGKKKPPTPRTKGCYSPAVRNMERMKDVAFPRKRELKERQTPAEVAFKELLHGLNIFPALQKVVFTANRYFILDFVVCMPHPRTIFEIDGGAHIGREGYDAERTRLVLATKAYSKYGLVRFTNEQVFNGEALAALEMRFPRQAQRRDKRLAAA